MIQLLEGLFTRKLALEAMKADGVDVGDALDTVNKEIGTEKAITSISNAAAYYKKRKRWLAGSDLSDKQKARIRELKSLEPRTIAREMLA